MEAALSNIEDLKGDALDSALEAVGLLEGNKSKSVEEKRDLLRQNAEQAQQQGEVRVAVAWPQDVFEHGIEGVDPITRSGVTIPRDKLDELKEAAEGAGATLDVSR